MIEQLNFLEGLALVDTPMLLAGALAVMMLVGFTFLGWLIVRLDRAHRAQDTKRGELHQLQSELAIMADSVQRFLIWTRHHGMVGEIDFSKLRSLYEEFCQLTGECPEDNQVLAKRLLQCGCGKPPLRWMKDANGKRKARKQFYIILDRQEAAARSTRTDAPVVPWGGASKGVIDSGRVPSVQGDLVRLAA